MTKPLSAEILTRMDYFIKTIYSTAQKRHFWGSMGIHAAWLSFVGTYCSMSFM